MGRKVIVDQKTCKCPRCGYDWERNMAIIELNFDASECCLCCPVCGELIEDGDEGDDNGERRKNMTVKEFCLHKTQVGELCVFRDCGWIIGSAWIDHEDLFTISNSISTKEVKKDEWGLLPVTTEHGDIIKIPCHYIDF